MKTKVNNLTLTICLGVFLSLSAYGQRDTIKYYPFILDAAIIDTNAYPIGISQDSFVITNNQELNSIFQIFKVISFTKKYSWDTTCNHGIYHLYKLYCKCNEYLLYDTLLKFNAYNNFKLLCYAYLYPRGITGNGNKNDRTIYKIYPNPVFDKLKIDAPLNSNYQILIYNSYGNLIFVKGKNESNNLINMSNQIPGIYYIQLTTDNLNLFYKIIKI